VRAREGTENLRKRIEDRDTRYFIDLDLKSNQIIRWDFGQRQVLSQNLPFPQHRVFLTKGQFRKLEAKAAEVKK
jgi:hypothetical protein